MSTSPRRRGRRESWPNDREDEIIWEGGRVPGKCWGRPQGSWVQGVAGSRCRRDVSPVGDAEPLA